MKKILGIGNALVDILVRVKDEQVLKDFGLPKGSMTLVDKTTANKILAATAGLDRQKSAGGSTANAVHGAGKLGTPSGYIGKIGDDEYGEFFRSYMEQSNICATMFTGKEETGKSIVLITEDGERTFATYLGASIELDPGELTPAHFSGYDMFLLEGYLVQDHTLVETAARLGKEAGCRNAIDLASFNIVAENREFLLDVVEKYIDIVFANEQEAAAFTGKEDPEAALADIARMTKVAVVKIGKEGSLIAAGNRKYRIDSIRATAIDTTGAGDLYASGFLFGRACGHPLDICGKIGSITSGKIVEVLGAKMDDATWDEVFGMVKEVEASLL